jgi:hypothetical protein
VARSRILAGTVALVLLVAANVAAPVARAECFEVPSGDSRVARPYVFTATVHEVATEPDLKSLAAGEEPGVLWHTTLEVRRVYSGEVPDALQLDGSTSTVGVGGGCSWFLGDRVEQGDVILVAIDDVTPFSANHRLFGHLLLWRRVGDEWRFYDRALQDGGEWDAYPQSARLADSTSAILAVIERLALPDTATAVSAGQASTTQPSWVVLLLAAGLGVAAASQRMARRGGSGTV